MNKLEQMFGYYLLLHYRKFLKAQVQKYEVRTTPLKYSTLDVEEHVQVQLCLSHEYPAEWMQARTSCELGDSVLENWLKMFTPVTVGPVVSRLTILLDPEITPKNPQNHLSPALTRLAFLAVFEESQSVDVATAIFRGLLSLGAQETFEGFVEGLASMFMEEYNE